MLLNIFTVFCHSILYTYFKFALLNLKYKSQSCYVKFSFSQITLLYITHFEIAVRKFKFLNLIITILLLQKKM